MTAPTTTPCETFLQNIIANWNGSGNVFFPTMSNTVFFNTNMTCAKPNGGKTVAKFVQTSLESRHAEKGVGMHYENGFMRCNDAKQLTWMLSHNSGNVEALSGNVSDDGKSVTLESDTIGGFPETQKTKRTISFSGENNDEMKYLFYMATLSVPNVTSHLQMSFTKIPDENTK